MAEVLKLIRWYRKNAYVSARLLGNWLPWLALLGGDSKAPRMIVRRQVNRTVGGLFGKFFSSGRRGPGAILGRLLGL